MNGAVRVFLLLSAIFAAGCGNYTITFRVNDVINSPGDESNRKRLDIDVVSLGKSDAQRHPDIASGGMLANNWFAARRGASGAPDIHDIPPRQIYCLRGKGPEYNGYSSNDNVRGAPLSSVRDGGAKEVTIKVQQSRFLEEDAAIVVFGRFHDGQGGDAAVAPVLIKPPPPWNTKIVIEVQAQKLVWVKPSE